MKKLMIVLALLASLALLCAADLSGSWSGILDAGQKLRVVFNFTQSGDSLSATMDSPDQQVFGLPVRSVVFSDPLLTLQMDTPPVEYSGELTDGVIKGTFKQMGYEFPLELTRGEVEKPVLVRPQEPKEPFPYRVEDVRFNNKQADLALAGTLTLPEGKGVYPAVILVSGSGPQNRDEELLGHKPFLVIADHFTRNGLAVLRYDDRGVGESEGDFGAATTADLLSDALAAVEYLKTREDIGDIGIAGHSEGGIIAPMAASLSPDVKGIVLMAGTGVRGDKLLLMQSEAFMRVAGASKKDIKEARDANRAIYDIVLANGDINSVKTEIRQLAEASFDKGSWELPKGVDKDTMINQLATEIGNPWMIHFLRLDPAVALRKVQCPVLAINGTKDLQVPYKPNLKAIGKALKQAKNKDYTLLKLKGLNHLFQECETGAFEEYAVIEQTIAPAALDAMTNWLKTRIK